MVAGMQRMGFSGFNHFVVDLIYSTPTRGVQIILEKVADSARKKVKVTEP